MSTLKLSQSEIKKEVTTFENGKTLKKSGKAGALKSSILEDLPSAVKQLDSLRVGTKSRRPIDLSFADYVQSRWGFATSDNGSPDSFYHLLGVSPSDHTLESLMTMPDFQTGYRWLVPEIIREAIRVGLNKNPMYPSLIAGEENVNQPSMIMPFINPADATPKNTDEAETIKVGSISFGQKTVDLRKVATGIKMTDEVIQFVPLNLLSIYLSQVGINLNQAQDTMAIQTLINGDQADGSGAITQVGVDNVSNGITYDEDLLLAWINMGSIGKLPTGIIGNKTSGMGLLKLPEFKGFNGLATVQTKLDLQTAIPAAQKVWMHGGMPTGNKILLLDAASALVKLNSASLRVENERIAERQINGTFVSLFTGFATLFDDARLLIDGTATIGAKPYPDHFDGFGAQVKSF